MIMAAEPKSAYDFSMKNIDGQTVDLAAYQGKVALFVNVASRCGFTPQYEGLENLYEKYKDKGLVVLGFPANDFLWQEPGDEGQIKQFCSTKYHVTFPMFAKIHVKGAEQAPLYEYLTKNTPRPGKVTWNFNKFLVGRDGRIIDRFDSKVKPDAAELVTALEKALASP